MSCFRHDGALFLIKQSMSNGIEAEKISEFKNPYDENDFQKIFEFSINKYCGYSDALPINLIVRGLPGSGKTYLSDFSASNILRCMSIDVDKLQYRGIGKDSHLEPREDNMDYQIMDQLIKALTYMGVNAVISGVFPKLHHIKNLCGYGYNFVFEFYSDLEASKRENVNGVSEKVLKLYAETFEPLMSIVAQ